MKYLHGCQVSKAEFAKCQKDNISVTTLIDVITTLIDV